MSVLYRYISGFPPLQIKVQIISRIDGEKKLVRVGFEPTPGFPDEKTCLAGKLSLESHALDRSAIAPLKPSRLWRATTPESIFG